MISWPFICKTLYFCRYDSKEFIKACPELQLVLSQIENGYFSPEQPDLFKDIVKTMQHGDRFMLCADFADYLRCQAEVDKAYMVSLDLDSRLIIHKHSPVNWSILFRMRRNGPRWCWRILPELGNSPLIELFESTQRTSGMFSLEKRRCQLLSNLSIPKSSFYCVHHWNFRWNSISLLSCYFYASFHLFLHHWVYPSGWW